MEQKNKTQNRIKNKRQNLAEILLIFIIIILAGYLSTFVFHRFDLTQEKRYTLSDKTKKILGGLNDIIYFKIYLDGDLPAGFKKLKNSAKEMLDEFRIYAGSNIEYEFIDPSLIADNKARNDLYRQLYENGLDPLNLQVKEKGGASSQKIIWPGAIISFQGKEIPLNLLVNNPGFSPEANLNISIETLEFNFITSIKKLSNENVQTIGFLEDHGEFDKYEVGDIAASLKEYYQVARAKLGEFLWSLKDSTNHNKFDAIIIAGPREKFSEKDKFIIDQYIMNGGRVLWCIDMVKVNMDSLAYSNSTLGLLNNCNLQDQIFHYCVRINPDIIQDVRCAPVPVNRALMGQQPNFVPSPWLFFPLLEPSQSSPITKNLNLVRSEFVSSLDTVGENPGIRKTFLLFTSNYTKILQAPVLVSLDIIDRDPDPRQFTRKQVPVAVLLEGKFESFYKNRLSTTFANDKSIGFRTQSPETRMIVIADGDIIKNQVHRLGDKFYPYALGFDKYTNRTYGNKEFIINTVNALLDNDGLMDIRAREFKLRLLDKNHVNQQRLFWQLINTLIPIALVILFGLGFYIFRKKQYTR